MAKNRSGCTCPCHSGAAMFHIQPCCQPDPIPARAASGDNQSPRDPDAIEAERFVAQNWNGEIGNFAIKAIQHGRALSKEAGYVGGE